ncbi:EF hand domain-containing protein [Rutstroemia sp. NJR-2017a BVV2]|nr:EF hand domain-containing protein [Rutstroemia sp. NJR-2017a BVV2]
MSASFSAASSTLTRTRGAILLLTTCVAAYGIYYLNNIDADGPSSRSSNGGLRRSNAVHRRHRRSSTVQTSEESSAPSNPLPVDEDANIVARPLTDGETVVDQDEFLYPGRAPTGDIHRNGQNVVQLLFRVSEDATRRNAYVHRGCGCNSCGVVPIRGIRYRCANCADFDLCEGCEAQGLHTKTHIFYKVRIPAPSFGPRQIQPVWYSGDPDRNARVLSKEMIAKFSRETGFERPELEAYWEQWTFMANADWRDDPDDIRLAMDRRTFERCLVPSGGYRNTTPSLIFDRMFAFYDTNKDDLIGFSEFLHGLAYRKKKDKWTKIFEGYDIDEDGYVDRKDFLRMFRSYYVLYRQMHRDMLEGLDDQQMMSTDAHVLVNSRQPLSGAFGQEGGRYPSAPDQRSGEGKGVRNGELEINDGRGVLRESSNDTGNREDILRHGLGQRSSGLPNIFGFARNSRGYWQGQISPPVSLTALSDLIERITNERVNHISSPDGQPEAHSDDDHDDETGDRAGADAAWAQYQQELHITDADVAMMCGPGFRLANLPRSLRPFVITHVQQKLEAQNVVHDRWKRRQFYTDEEEGATAPEDWDEAEDVLTRNGLSGDSSKFQSQHRPSIHSRSSSKVRFAEDMDDFDTRSNPSTSSRSVPERWGGMEIPDAERDAGKEILYQVTQQAFNELLDPLFKEKEDLALKAAATKEDREKYRHLFSTEKFTRWANAKAAEEEKRENPNHMKVRISTTERSSNAQSVWPDIPEVEVDEIRERPLETLLNATGYTVEEPDENESTEAVPVPDSAPSPPSLVPRAAVPDANAAVADYHEFAINTYLTPEQRAEYYAANSPGIQSPTGAQDAINNEDSQDTSIFQHQQTETLLSSQSTPQRTPSPSSPALSPYRDPTLPQFRPNTDANTSLPEPPRLEAEPMATSSNPESSSISNKKEKKQKVPSREKLYKLWKLDKITREGKERGGLGKLNFKEFEKAVKKQAGSGKSNAMDYLGSWIEFCIP